MISNTQEMREARCRLYTVAGWMHGTMHIPARVQLLEFLNHSGQIYRMTDVALPGRPSRERFFAVERSAIIIVIPDNPTEITGVRSIGARRSHHVLWLLPSGSALEGVMDILQDVRVSDHLIHNDGFVVLHGATFFERVGASTMVEPGVAAVALQASRAIGVTEISEEGSLT